VQNGINIALYAEFNPSSYCYNLTAGDLMKDEEINVIDVVRLINKLLDNTSAAPRMAPLYLDGQTQEPAPTADVLLYVQNGQLMMLTEKTVGAIDLTLTGNLKDAVWMPGNTSYGATTREHSGMTRAIVCAMNGDSLQVGQTLLADLTQLMDQNISISHAMVTDPQGQPLTVQIVGGDADGIRQIENGELIIDNSPIYDVSGRKLSTLHSPLSTLPKGLYIVNGKKHVIK
jgi:hypothetical protein